MSDAAAAVATAQVSSRLASIRSSIAQFRLEQEEVFLDLTSQDPTGATLDPTTGGLDDVNRYVQDVSVLLVPLVGGSNAWPRALVANFSDRHLEMGGMESHGSLWRLIPTTATQPDKATSSSSKASDVNKGILRALLQTAELGEDVLYLSSDLELVTEPQAAAKWTVKVIPADRLLSSAALSATGHGILVQLELLSASDEPAGQGTGRLLCSGTSDSGKGGLAVLSAAQRLSAGAALEGPGSGSGSGSLSGPGAGEVRWINTFEVIREDTPVPGLEGMGEEFHEAR